MIFSKKCINETKGFQVIDGIIVWNELGAYVLTTEEADKILKERLGW